VWVIHIIGIIKTDSIAYFSSAQHNPVVVVHVNRNSDNIAVKGRSSDICTCNASKSIYHRLPALVPYGVDEGWIKIVGFVFFT
jgi:hypothetical protein